MKKTLVLTLVLWLVSAIPTAAVDDPEPVSIVATTEVLGSVVGQLAGDVADVTTLMRDGVDPHSWQPSARDSEAIFEADVVVANGLDLEEGLASVLEQAEADGVTVFHAADHVRLRSTAGADPDHSEEADHSDEPDHNEHPLTTTDTPPTRLTHQTPRTAPHNCSPPDPHEHQPNHHTQITKEAVARNAVAAAASSRLGRAAPPRLHCRRAK